MPAEAKPHGDCHVRRAFAPRLPDFARSGTRGEKVSSFVPRRCIKLADLQRCSNTRDQGLRVAGSRAVGAAQVRAR